MAGGTLAYATQRTSVPWWSFTKTVIAAAILSLVRDDELQLDEPYEGRGFSLRQVLQHRAGLADYGGLSAYHEAVDAGDPPWSVEEMLERAQADLLLFPPGSRFSYSNIGYLMLRQTLECVCDCPLSDALTRLIPAPLDIDGVKLIAAPAPLSGLRAGYHPDWVYHGLLAGPLDQAALLLQRLMQSDLLPQALRAQMSDGMIVADEIPGRPFKRPAYGLGTMVDAIDTPVIGHSGGGPDSTIAVYWAPATQRAAAVFAADHHTGAVETRAMVLIGDEEAA